MRDRSDLESPSSIFFAWLAAGLGIRRSELTRIKAAKLGPSSKADMKWQAIATAPYDVDLELAVVDARGTHALVFPCRRIPAGWLKSGSNEWIDICPTHWREWKADRHVF